MKVSEKAPALSRGAALLLLLPLLLSLAACWKDAGLVFERPPPAGRDFTDPRWILDYASPEFAAELPDGGAGSLGFVAGVVDTLPESGETGLDLYGDAPAWLARGYPKVYLPALPLRDVEDRTLQPDARRVILAALPAGRYSVDRIHFARGLAETLPEDGPEFDVRVGEATWLGRLEMVRPGGGEDYLIRYRIDREASRGTVADFLAARFPLSPEEARRAAETLTGGGAGRIFPLREFTPLAPRPQAEAALRSILGERLACEDGAGGGPLLPLMARKSGLDETETVRRLLDDAARLKTGGEGAVLFRCGEQGRRFVVSRPYADYLSLGEERAPRPPPARRVVETPAAPGPAPAGLAASEPGGAP